MKTSTLIVLISLTLFSCTSEQEVEKKAQTDTTEEVKAPPVVPQYPIRIKHTNLKKYLAPNGPISDKYDSLIITILSDSNYFYKYYKNGTGTPYLDDTLKIPQQIDTIKINRSSEDSLNFLPAKFFMSPGNGTRLFVIELEDKTYKIIETRGSCCSIWEPRGHIHFGSITYFSLDFGFLGSFDFNEKNSSKHLWTGDWDQKTVDKIVEQLLLFHDSPQFRLNLKVRED